MTDANDRQVGGNHYKQYELDPWDAIAIFCPKRLVGAEIYLWGCAFKYMVRLGSKGPVLEDLEKAEHYLQKLRQTLEKKLAERVGTSSVTSHGQGRSVEEMVEGTSQGPSHAVEYLESAKEPKFEVAFRIAGGDEQETVRYITEAYHNVELALMRAHVFKHSEELQKAVSRLGTDTLQILRIFPSIRKRLLEEESE